MQWIFYFTFFVPDIASSTCNNRIWSTVLVASNGHVMKPVWLLTTVITVTLAMHCTRPGTIDLGYIGNSAKPWNSGSWFYIKIPSYQYRKSRCGNQMILRSSYLRIMISYTFNQNLILAGPFLYNILRKVLIFISLNINVHILSVWRQKWWRDQSTDMLLIGWTILLLHCQKASVYESTTTTRLGETFVIIGMHK